MRKLASVQTVLEINEIEGADSIELARIGGWQCVVKKGQFKPGDLGVFFEIDSRPPDSPVFSFLWNKKEETDTPQPANFRLKTMKLRGVLSQGLLMPVSTFSCDSYAQGEDVTDLLGVTKWEPAVPVGMDIDGPFISGVPKTDEPRIQSNPGLLDEIRGLPWVGTLKCDGSSVTFGVDKLNSRFMVCSRNWGLKKGDNAAWAMVKKYDLEMSLTVMPGVVIQAELVGPGIQGNRLGLTSHEIRVFNVFDQFRGVYLDHESMTDVCKVLSLPVAPVLYSGESFGYNQDELLALAEGKYPGTDNEREGIVIRPVKEMRSEVLGGRLSFKVISNKFLLKGGE